MAHIIKSIESFDLSSDVNKDVSYESAVTIPSETDVEIESDVTFVDEKVSVEYKRSDAEIENDKLHLKIKDLESQILKINAEYDEKIETSVNEGFKSGFEKGRSEYQSSIQNKLNSFDELIGEIQKDYKNNLLDSADDLVEIIFTSVTKIIAAGYSKDILIGYVNRHIDELSNSDTIKLHVSSADIEFFHGYKFNNDLISVTVDSRVRNGGCIIESDKERLDCRLDKKIEIFKSLLMDSRSNVN